MEEDEEVLPENSDLKVYLQKLGFSDISATQTSSKESALNFKVPKRNSEKFTKECIDVDVIEQVGILLSAQMLFDEDVSNIERLLSNFTVVKSGMLKNMFQGSAAAFVILLGLCLYWFIGGYGFIIVSTYYAYRASDYLWKKHFSLNRLKNLMAALKSNYLLLKKTVRFIQENENIVQANISQEYCDNFNVFNNLRQELTNSENEVIKILSKATQKLVKVMPLYDYVENPQYYLCNKYRQMLPELDLLKLHQVYALIQSEFLQRVALSLIPNLQATNRDLSYQQFNKILHETTFNLVRLESKLNKKFKYVYFNGIHSANLKGELKTSPKRDGSLNYAREFVTNIHDTSNTLQDLLIKSRTIESNFNGDILPESIENELVNIQNNLVTCQKNISDSFILLKKLNSINCTDEFQRLSEQEIESPDEKSNQILVGYTDLDPKVDDEVFEAFFACENNNERDIDDDYDFEDRIKKRLEREYSKKVLDELKAKLVEKAKDWEIREANALKKKGGSSKLNEDVIKQQEMCEAQKNENRQNKLSEEETDEDLKLVENNQEASWPLGRVKRCQIPRKNGRIVHYSGKDVQYEEDNTGCDRFKDVGIENEEDSDSEEEIKVNRFRMPETFLAKIKEAREGILTSSDVLEEELFYDSEEG